MQLVNNFLELFNKCLLAKAVFVFKGHSASIQHTVIWALIQSDFLIDILVKMSVIATIVASNVYQN